MTDFPKLLEKLGPDGIEELRRLVAEEIAKRGGPQAPPAPPTRTIPGPDEDLRPRA